MKERSRPSRFARAGSLLQTKLLLLLGEGRSPELAEIEEVEQVVQCRGVQRRIGARQLHRVGEVVAAATRCLC